MPRLESISGNVESGEEARTAERSVPNNMLSSTAFTKEGLFPPLVLSHRTSGEIN